MKPLSSRDAAPCAHSECCRMAGNGSELRKLPALLPFLGGGGNFHQEYIYIFWILLSEISPQLCIFSSGSHPAFYIHTHLSIIVSFPGKSRYFPYKSDLFELTSGILIQPRIIASPLYKRYTSAGLGRRWCDPSIYLVSPGEGWREAEKL